MKKTQDNPSCALPRSGKRRVGLWLGLIATTTAAGALIGDVYSGLVLGMLLGLPLIGSGT